MDGLYYWSPFEVPNKLRRGGCPVLFPQFADRGPLKKHGYARDFPFETLLDEQVGEQRHLVQALSVNEGQWPNWPQSARLTLSQRFGGNSYDCTLEVRNTGHEPIEWTGGLHPYFLVGDIKQATLIGLDHALAKPKAGTHIGRCSEGNMTFGSGELESLFPVTGPLSLIAPSLQRVMHLKCHGFSQWMVWNPGEALGNALGDIPAGDWARFVCIEPVFVDKPHHIDAGASFRGGFSVLTECYP